MAVPDNSEVPATADDLRGQLKEVFGFDSFRKGQEDVVSRLAQGRSVLAVFPTGGGKSLCYQLPALGFDGLTLVISPLIALMKDQLDFLDSRGVAAARLDSSLDRDQTLAVYDALRARSLKLLYISPERLGNERFLQTLKHLNIAMLAIDEAHCISEWGHNFRPDYLKIARLARDLSVGRVLALTATATPQVAQDIATAFDIAPDDMIQTGFYRPNLNLRISPCENGDRKTLLLQRLREQGDGPGIVYVTLQHTAEDVAEYLSANGLNARAYHAGMKSEDRTAIQDAFMASDRMVIVATIAFGMGIDKANIRFVYHYNLPKGMESYMQEIGRAGRDGLESVCEILACADDVVTLENFSYGDTPDDDAVQGLVEEVLGLGDLFDVSVYDLSGRYDMRPLVVKTLLTYLELDKVIESMGPFYSGYKFQPQRSSQAIFADFDENRANFLRSIFRHAKKGKTWFSLDADSVSQSLGEPRDRIVAALSHLEQTGDLLLQASGLRLGYRRLRVPKDIVAFRATLSERFATRERNDIARIHGILRFTEHESCLTRFVLDYFGEKRDDCGHCSRCAGDTAKPLPALNSTTPGPDHAKKLEQLRAEGHDALASPRQLARFLCGLSSPATTRAKLRGHALYGLFSSIPFNKVLDFVKASK